MTDIRPGWESSMTLAATPPTVDLQAGLRAAGTGGASLTYTPIKGVALKAGLRAAG